MEEQYEWEHNEGYLGAGAQDIINPNQELVIGAGGELFTPVKGEVYDEVEVDYQDPEVGSAGFSFLVEYNIKQTGVDETYWQEFGTKMDNSLVRGDGATSGGYEVPYGERTGPPIPEAAPTVVAGMEAPDYRPGSAATAVPVPADPEDWPTPEGPDGTEPDGGGPGGGGDWWDPRNWPGYYNRGEDWLDDRARDVIPWIDDEGKLDLDPGEGRYLPGNPRDTVEEMVDLGAMMGVMMMMQLMEGFGGD